VVLAVVLTQLQRSGGGSKRGGDRRTDDKDDHENARTDGVHHGVGEGGVLEEDVGQRGENRLQARCAR